jgi:uncharacterized protein (TIGR04255 family)
VALAIVFEELAGFSSAHAGAFWARQKAAYPRAEDHPPLKFKLEVPPESPQFEEKPKLEFVDAPKVRSWFLDRTGTQLIQVQSDAFVRNWRQREGPKGAPTTYPHYETLRASLIDDFRTFASFAGETGWRTLAPRQCEVTYVNHVRVPGPEGSHSSVARVLRCFSELGGGFLPKSEDSRFAIRYPIRVGSQFKGRLIVTVQPAYVIETGEEILNLSLVARGAPLGTGLDGSLAFLDLGHEWIVRGFTELTTEEMHTFWGRTT